MNYRKLAQLMKNEYFIVVWREEENKYWVSDGIILVRLDQDTFNKFKSKYSAYKNNPYIRDMEVGEKVQVTRAGLLDQGPDIEAVLEGAEDAEDITITKFLFITDDTDPSTIMYIGNGFYGLLNVDYFNLFGWDYEYKTSDGLKPVYVIDRNEEVAGIIMPMWITGLELEEEIEKIKGVI